MKDVVWYYEHIRQLLTGQVWARSNDSHQEPDKRRRSFEGCLKVSCVGTRPRSFGCDFLRKLDRFVTYPHILIQMDIGETQGTHNNVADPVERWRPGGYLSVSCISHRLRT